MVPAVTPQRGWYALGCGSTASGVTAEHTVCDGHGGVSGGGRGRGQKVRTARFYARGLARTRSRRLALLFLLCAVPAALESYLVRYPAGLHTGLQITPQISALWPYGSFHDLRWVLVYHRTWAQFVAFSVAAIVLRGVYCALLIGVAWPRDVPRPAMDVLIRRGVLAAAVFGAVLTPWAALSVALSDVSLGVFLLGEVAPLLVLAPFLQRAAMVPAWWRGLPPATTVAISVLNFILLTVGGGVAGYVPDGWEVVGAAAIGGCNGFLWDLAAHVDVRAQAVRWGRVPVSPIAVAVVAALMFALGSVSQRGVDRPHMGEPATLAKVEARAADQPAIFVAGYNSSYNGEPIGFTPPIFRYSYEGLDERGRPRPYRPTDTHQSIVTSARLLATQISKIHSDTGKRVSILGESEGTLITRYYLMTTPHADVDLVALLSPLVRAGRVYYPPPDAHTGWGIATGWELRGILGALRLTGGLPNSPDEPFLRSLLDNAPMFRGKELLCPVGGVETIALLPTLDASANPPGLTPQISVVEIPAPHGLLIDNPAARQRVIDFFKAGHVQPQHRWDYALIQSVGAAWQTPALKVQFNPVWATVAGIPTRRHHPDRCLPR